MNPLLRLGCVAGLAIWVNAAALGAAPPDAVTKALSQNDWATARGLLEVATRSPKASARDWMMLGNVRFRLKDYIGAIQAYTQVPPQEAELFALAGLGRSRAYRALGDIPKSVSEFQRIDDPKTQPGISQQLQSEKAKLHESLNAMGLDMIKAKRFSDALSALQQASGLQGSAENTALLGWTYFELQQWQQAEDAFERVVEQPEGRPYWEDAEDFINLVLGKRDFIGIGKPFVNLQIGLGWNSNFILEPLIDNPSVKGMETRLSLLTGTEWFAHGSWSSVLAYQVALARSLEDGHRRFLNHGFLLPLSYTRARSRFSITPSMTWSVQDSLLLASRARIRADWSQQHLRSQWGFGLSYTRSWARSTLYPYLYGHTVELSGFWRRSLQGWNWLLRIPVTRDIYSDNYLAEPLTYDSIGVETAFEIHAGKGWFWEPQVSVSVLRFDRRPDFSDPRRMDERLVLSQRLIRTLSDKADLYLSQDYLFQQSNFPVAVADQRLRQLSISIGTDLRF